MQIGYRNHGTNSYGTRFSIGFLEKYQEHNENALEIIKDIVSKFSITATKEEIIDEINKKLKNSSQVKNEFIEKYKGYEIIEKLIDYFDIFNDCKVTKSVSLTTTVKQMIFQRIKDPKSILGTCNEMKEHNLKTFSKNSFYRALEYISDNRNEILKNINAKLMNDFKRNVEVIWFDSTITYFETFARNAMKMPGYSKDGKFKEDQMVIGMATDINGIPLYYKVFPGNTADSSSFIPFIVELAKIYNIKKVTIVADRGMWTNANIRFLEDKNFYYIISYRLKSATKDFKNFVLNQDNYQTNNEGLRYKTREVDSLFKKARFNGHTKKQIITYSDKRAKKDFEDRKILIDNFYKKATNGVVNYTDLVGSKKCRFYKASNKNGYYLLDHEKIEKDQQFDGYYVYETNRLDLSEKDVINFYARQWQIEENFRTLKGTLELRSIYLQTWKHIEGYICLCFLALVLLKFLVYQINYSTGLEDKNKFTINKIVKIIQNVKVLKHYSEETLIKSIKIKNASINEHWSNYEIIKKILNI
ncbi:IS1634 family transposase [Mycoplasmopsis synoviae]|uniref:IS1634 family transposase n=2 Tax=Mycoplasmopsis synoviae TaxID=2109 RepID=UPI0009E3F859|nr:IS1634 family transposase [Mycoplasmopsis synoviae]